MLIELLKLVLVVGMLVSAYYWSRASRNVGRFEGAGAVLFPEKPEYDEPRAWFRKMFGHDLVCPRCKERKEPRP